MYDTILMGTKRVTVRWSKPTSTPKAGVLIISGISHGATHARYDQLANELAAHGYLVLRPDIWKTTEDVQSSTLGQLVNACTAAIDALLAKGCQKICIVGKSWGGGIALMLRHPSIKATVCWAPAFIVGQANHLDQWMDRPIREAKSFAETGTNAAFLSTLKTPVMLIHGTADDQIPLSNSQEIYRALPNAELATIPDADHSYHQKEQMDRVVRLTVEFLEKHTN